MTQKEIIGKIKQEVEYCEGTHLRGNPSYAKTQLNVLDLVDKYMNSQYKDSGLDDFNQPKPFYNIVSVPVEVAGKMLDIDTKDIILMSEDENYWTSWIMEKELKFWMKDKQFGIQLNQYSDYLPRDGHLVVKKVDKEVQIVPLSNLRFRPDAVSLDKIPIIERHLYQVDEFIAIAKKRGWNNWKAVVEKNNANNSDKTLLDKSDQIEIYEAYFPDGLLDNKYNYFIISQGEEMLAFANLSSSPYKHTSYKKIKGRTLGKGVVEELFNEQIYLNRTAIYKANGLYWTSKHMWQTRDNTIAKNLMSNIDDGEVMIVNSDITPVQMEERNLGFYNYDETKWEENAYKRTFAREPITGGRAPSGTPLGSTILQAQMSGGFYKQKKENLASFIKEILWDWVLPEFKKEKKEEHSVILKNILSSDDMSEKFLKMQLDDRMNKIVRKGNYMSPEQLQFRRAINADIIKNSKLKIPKGVYENLKQKMSIVITGEEIDTASKLTTLQTVFQMLGSNPGILRDKRVRKVFNKMLDIAGFNPNDLDLEEEPSIEDITGQNRGAEAQRGGSIATPQVPNMASQLRTQTVL